MGKTKITDIDLEIEKLKKKKKNLISKREKDIGAYLLKTWNVEHKTDEEIFKLIEENKPNVGDKNEQNR